jgi:hypothetical protein
VTVGLRVVSRAHDYTNIYLLDNSELKMIKQLYLLAWIVSVPMVVVNAQNVQAPVIVADSNTYPGIID